MVINLNMWFIFGLYSLHRMFLVFANPSELILDFTDDRFMDGEYFEEIYITTIAPSSVYLCLQECARRSPCERISFKRSTLECTLLTKLVLMGPSSDNDAISSDLDRWNNTVEWFGECGGVNCTGTSICIVSPQNGPHCLGYKCSGDPPSKNRISGYGNQVGSRAQYTCSGTYQEDQGVSSYCLPNGEWSTPTQCDHCGDPPIVNNSLILEPISHQKYDVIWYTCPGSYETQQNITSTCHENTNWTTPTHCKHCGEPPFVNNSHFTEPITQLQGEVIRYECLGSYLQDQNITSTCQQNTEWTQPSSCKHCGDPQEIESGVVTLPISHDEGAVIEYTCPRAYTPHQNISSVCQTDGQWTQPDDCRHCGDPPELPVGIIEGQVNHMENETISYLCNAKSYSRNQNITSTCQADGTWTTPQYCKHCGPPPSPVGGVLEGEVLHQEDEVIIYRCPSSYDTSQEINSTCQSNGQWSSTVDCKHCGEPPFLNNSHFTEPITHLQGEVIRYECPGSYLQDQNITSTCQQNTEWTQPSSCKHCGEPPRPVGGEIVGPVSHQRGEVISYSCPNTHSLQQNITSTCQPDGQWSETTNCSHCGEPPEMDIGMVHQVSYVEGGEAAYLCTGTYADDQNITAICQSNTTWSQPRPCKYCGEPLQENLISQPTNYLQGDEVYYNCSDMNVTSTCEADGQWTFKQCPENTESTGPPDQHCQPPEEMTGETLVEPPRPWYAVGEEVEYRCKEAYYAKSRCTPQTSWTHPKCSKLASCQNLRNCNQTYPDGDYWLYPNDKPTKIYCHNMAEVEGEAKEFISLQAENTVRIPNFQQDASTCNEAQYNASFYNVTQFFKIGVNPVLMEILRDDFTFTNVSNSNTPYNYGEGRGCSYTTQAAEIDCLPKGTFIINLTGTGLRMETRETEWQGSGPRAVCRVTKQSDVEYNGKVDGDCGECKASTITYLMEDPQTLPESAATVPHCTSD